jgi:NAD(P)-dependent dehydrogenase (short-subunit alcohol dehydrogenase family)
MSVAPEATEGILRFDGRVALVTGAGRGMGREHALLLARRGAEVVVSDRGTDVKGFGADAGPANEVAAEIELSGGTAVAYSGDLASEDGARGAVRMAMEVFGRIDLLVHSAGFSDGVKRFENETLERFDHQMGVNARAFFGLVQECWATMKERQYGRIVATASSALYGIPFGIPYSTAKASYIGLVRGLAREGADLGIRVNAIEPSGLTRMAEKFAASEPELGQWFAATMRPELVAPVVAYLSHETCEATGEFFVVGGGRVARTVLGETQGFCDPNLTPEAIRDHIDEVMAQGPAAYPAEMMDSLRLARQVLQ